MFTGIIQAVGKIAQSQARGPDVRLTIAAGGLDLADVQLGDSIAVNGVCLTVVTKHATSFDVDVSAETLRCTIGFDLDGAVNLEKALRLADRLGGHLVSGHVDGVGSVQRFEQVGDCYLLQVVAPSALARYIAAKGSITINGVSLTVNHVQDDSFDVNLIPHTMQHTTLQYLTAGSPVNLEIDQIARYVERMTEWSQQPEST